MRGVWSGLTWLALMVVIVGCHSYEPHLRAPKPVESFAGPPDDPRYQNPPKYPAEAMKKAGPKKPDGDDGSTMPSGPRMSGPGGPGASGRPGGM